MPPKPEPNIALNDDAIAEASAKATELGKKSFDEQKNAFGTVRDNLEEGGTKNIEQKVQPVVIKSLRTYQGDIAEAIRNQNTSVLTIAMAEQERVGLRATQKEKDEFKPRTILERIRGEKPQPRVPTPEFVPPRIEPSPSRPPTPFAPPPIFNTPPTKSTNPVQVASNFPSKIVFGTAPQKKIDNDFRRDAITIAVSILLILLGVGAVVGFYFLQKTPQKTTTTPESQLTIIPYTTEEAIPANHLDREALLQKLNDFRRGNKIPDGSVHYVALTEGATSTVPITTEDLFAILKTNIPGNALRAFDTKFMLGFYGAGGNQPFLLISLTSFDNTFDGMLQWEKDMYADVGTIFSPATIPLTQYVPTGVPVTGSSSGTTGITAMVSAGSPPNDNFSDITIQNKDARVLKNSRAETLLLYSFINQNTLLITTNETVLREMIGKFASQQYVR